MNISKYPFNGVHYIELLKKTSESKKTREERTQLLHYRSDFFCQLAYEARNDFLSLLSEQRIVKAKTGLSILSEIDSLSKEISKKRLELEKNPEVILNISIDPKAEKFYLFVNNLLDEYEYISDLELEDRNYQALKDLLRRTRDEIKQYLAS